MNAIEKLGGLAKPVFKAGALFTWELLRGGVLTLVLSFGVLAFVLPVLMSSTQGFAGGAHTGGAGAALSLLVLVLQPAGLVLILLAIVFPFLYVMFFQKRAVARAAHAVFSAHGEALYDSTVGRFVSKQLGEQPGLFAQWVAKPNAFASKVNEYLEHSEQLPKIVRRIAKYFASSFVESSSVHGLIVNGQSPSASQVREMALLHAQDALRPSWRTFVILFVLHVATAMAAWFWFK